MELIIIYYVEAEPLGYDHDSAIRINHEVIGVYKYDNIGKAIEKEYEDKENHFIEYLTLGQLPDKDK